MKIVIQIAYTLNCTEKSDVLRHYFAMPLHWQAIIFPIDGKGLFSNNVPKGSHFTNKSRISHIDQSHYMHFC